jgi:hypothetical protein
MVDACSKLLEHMFLSSSFALQMVLMLAFLISSKYGKTSH